jgi:hypothetical protein
MDATAIATRRTTVQPLAVEAKPVRRAVDAVLLPFVVRALLDALLAHGSSWESEHRGVL